jgi:hypothetical protein
MSDWIQETITARAETLGLSAYAVAKACDLRFHKSVWPATLLERLVICFGYSNANSNVSRVAR